MAAFNTDPDGKQKNVLESHGHYVKVVFANGTETNLEYMKAEDPTNHESYIRAIIDQNLPATWYDTKGQGFSASGGGAAGLPTLVQVESLGEIRVYDRPDLELMGITGLRKVADSIQIDHSGMAAEPLMDAILAKFAEIKAQVG